jgi:small GTP-binding protein
VRLADTIGRLLGRVEVVITGSEGWLRDGQDALDVGDFMRARQAAHEILARAPGSPVGLALLADACELGGLDAELAMTLEDLARRVTRADVWVRLARARQATRASSDDVRDAYVRALAVAEAGSEARRDALLALADGDLAAGDGARADLWLERTVSDRSPDVALRRAEARLTRGDADAAIAWLATFESAATDGRGALARGRALALKGSADAFAHLVRAMVLEVPAASEHLSSALAWIPTEEATRARIRTVVEGRGEAHLARWRAAFARAEGRRDEAREALKDALRAGDVTAARPLLDAGLEDQDQAAVAQALASLADGTTGDGGAADPVVRDARRIPSRDALDDAARAPAVLDDLAAIGSDRVLPWAEAMRARVIARWVPPAPSLSPGASTGPLPTDWSATLARLDAHARALHDLDATARIADLAAERTRPVRLAIVGEFNAGKSTFINALIGADVAPTGVLPTTATLHHLRYAPDPIARILFRPGTAPPERIVPIGELRATLKTCDVTTVRRVEILLPIASLTRVEILDTPGFNAPDEKHTEAARGAFEEADAAVWLLDAAQAMKRTEKEILDEARAARLPVQILLNKADRLAPDEVATVMRTVAEGLAEAGFSSWSPPLALSARRALAGKLGDAAALADSGWAAVEALLDAQIIGRSEELKERALRRRALAIVALLGQGAARIADDERRRSDALHRRADATSRAAAALDRDADTIAARIAEGLAAPAASWAGDLSTVVTGRDPEAAARDVTVLRYRVERALARLARPLGQALAVAAPGADVSPAELAPTVRALVRAFAASTGDPSDVLPLARAAVATLLEQLGAAAMAERAPPALASGRVLELAALARALA